MILLNGEELRWVLLNEEDPRLIIPMPKTLHIYFYHDDRFGSKNNLELFKKYNPEQVVSPTNEDLCIYRITVADPKIEITTG